MKAHNMLLLLCAAALGVSALCSVMSAATHDQDPRIISRIEPDYRFDLRKAGTEGAVLVSFVITSRGDVTDLVALRSTHPAFEESTLAAMKHWKFSPAMKDGHAVDLPAMQLVTFTAPGREPRTSTVSLIGTMTPCSIPRGIETVKASTPDPCFCGSGKSCDTCHGAYKPRHSKGHA